MRARWQDRARVAGLALVALAALAAPRPALAVPHPALYAILAGGIAALPNVGAIPPPEVFATVGNTLAVLGKPNGGGFSTSGAVLWPFEDHYAFGLTAFADDMGADIDSLWVPSDPRVLLGVVELAHRWTYGAAWRLDARLAPVLGWTPVASGTWGFARVADDRRGTRTALVGSTGFSLAGGVRHPVLKRSTLGATVRYSRLFNDTAGRYMSAALEWGWR